MPRIRYSDAVRADILRRVGSGELSHTQAAREIGCSLSTIQKWLTPRRQNTNVTAHSDQNLTSHSVTSLSGPPTVHSPHESSASFIPIHLTEVPIRPTETRSTTLELTTPSGIHIRLTSVTSDFVLEVLKTLS